MPNSFDKIWNYIRKPENTTWFAVKPVTFEVVNVFFYAIKLINANFNSSKDNIYYLVEEITPDKRIKNDDVYYFSKVVWERNQPLPHPDLLTMFNKLLNIRNHWIKVFCR